MWGEGPLGAPNRIHHGDRAPSSGPTDTLLSVSPVPRDVLVTCLCCCAPRTPASSGCPGNSRKEPGSPRSPRRPLHTSPPARSQGSGGLQAPCREPTPGALSPEANLACCFVSLEFFLAHLVLKSEKAIAPHSSTLAWKIPRMEEPGGLQSMGSLRVGYDWRLHFHFSLLCIGEGNGNPLQCSCLENPRDGGSWWAAIYGVAQSWT